MMYRIYKTLFFALLSVLFWVGSVILAFFGGAVFQSMMTDRDKEKEQAEKDGPDRVRHTGPSRRPCGDVPIPGE